MPEGVCPKCLAYYRNCNHRNFQGFKDYLCEKSDVFFLVCNQCAHHTTAQDWARKNFNPSRGKKLLSGIRANIPNYSATINSIRAKQQCTDSRTKFSVTKNPNHETTTIEETLNNEDVALVPTVLVNGIQIRKDCCPYEVIRIKVGSTYLPVAIIYDIEAQMSLCNYETGPLLISTKPATFSTVNSTRGKLRTTHTLGLSDRFQIDAVPIPDLRLNLQSMEIPEEWRHLEDEIADQDTSGVYAQILVGADKATIFPHCELNKYEKPVQVGSCRLMRSHLTNRLIMSRAYEVHEDSEDTTRDTSQFNHIRPNTSGDDVLTNSMNTLARSGIDPANIKQESKLTIQ